MPSSKAWGIPPTHQEKEVLGSGQLSFTDRGSASGDGTASELGRAKGRDLGSGRSNRTGPSPTPNISSSLHELGSCGPTCSEAVENGVGLSQELLLRSPCNQTTNALMASRGTTHTIGKLAKTERIIVRKMTVSKFTGTMTTSMNSPLLPLFLFLAVPCYQGTFLA